MMIAASFTEPDPHSGHFYAGEHSETIVLSSESDWSRETVRAACTTVPWVSASQPHHPRWTSGCCERSSVKDRDDRSSLEASPDTNGHPNTDGSLFGRQILVKSSLPESAERCPPFRYKDFPRRPSALSSVPPHPLPSRSCALRRCTGSSPGYGAPSHRGLL